MTIGINQKSDMVKKNSQRKELGYIVAAERRSVFFEKMSFVFFLISRAIQSRAGFSEE